MIRFQKGVAPPKSEARYADPNMSHELTLSQFCHDVFLMFQTVGC